MCITGIRQPKNASELVDGEITNIPNLQLWGFRAHLQFDDLNFVGYDGGFATFVEGIIEHVNCVCVELGAEAGPFERE